MKSAYELAMERLQKAWPRPLSLTNRKRNSPKWIRSLRRENCRERAIPTKDQIRKAQTEGKADDIDSIQKQLVSEIRRLQEECESKKEKTP